MSVKNNCKTILKKLFIILICAAAVTAPSCSSSARKYSVTYTDLFDTVTDFTAYCKSEAEFKKASDKLYSELLRLHRLFDIYNEYDGVKNAAYLNRVCGDGAAELDPDIKALIVSGLRSYGETNGKLNVFSGAVLSVWHKYREAGNGVPTDAELKEAAKHISADSVVTEGDTVRFTDKELRLDFGSIAKGYASRVASDAVKSLGVKDFIINIGGNVVVSGKKADGLWKIGVQNPFGDGIYAKLGASDVSVVTSGDYERYYEYNGKKYHHIIDLDTLYPADGFCSVTVVCKDPEEADALSTALFCMSVEEGRALAEKYGAEVLWIKSDGGSERTKGFSAYEK